MPDTFWGARGKGIWEQRTILFGGSRQLLITLLCITYSEVIAAKLVFVRPRFLDFVAGRGKAFLGGGTAALPGPRIKRRDVR